MATVLTPLDTSNCTCCTCTCAAIFTTPDRPLTLDSTILFRRTSVPTDLCLCDVTTPHPFPPDGTTGVLTYYALGTSVPNIPPFTSASDFDDVYYGSYVDCFGTTEYIIIACDPESGTASFATGFNFIIFNPSSFTMGYSIATSFTCSPMTGVFTLHTSFDTGCDLIMTITE